MLNVLVLTLRSIVLLHRMVAPMQWRTYMLVLGITTVGCTLQECITRLMWYDLNAFAYGWVEITYRVMHGSM